jgi:hypothetical protein
MNRREDFDDMELFFGRKDPDSGANDQPLDNATLRDMKRLQTLAEHLGADGDFYPDDAEVDMMVARVDGAIDQLRPAGNYTFRSKILAMSWLRRATAVAAVVLLLGTGFLAYLEHRAAQQPPSLDDVSYETVLMSMRKPDVVAAAIGTDYQALDDDAIDQLLYEYTSNARFSAGERLLNDLSEEELNYLQTHFNVGDIL